MEEFDIRRLLIDWNRFNQNVKRRIYQYEEIGFICRNSMRLLKKPVDELIKGDVENNANDQNLNNACNNPKNADQTMLSSNNFEELKLVDDVLRKAERIRNNTNNKHIQIDSIRKTSMPILINDFTEHLNINKPNVDNEFLSKDIFPSNNILIKNSSCISIYSKNINTNFSKSKQSNNNFNSKENNINKTKIVIKDNKLSKIPAKSGQVTSNFRTQPNKPRSKITLIKPISSQEKINKITKSFNTISSISEKKDQLLKQDKNYGLANGNLSTIYDNEQFTGNKGDSISIDIIKDTKSESNICQIDEKNADILNFKPPYDDLLVKKVLVESNFPNLKIHLKELMSMKKKLLKNSQLRNKLKTDIIESADFISLLEKNNNLFLEAMDDSTAYSYKRCQYYSLCKQAIFNIQKEMDLKEFIDFSNYLITKILSERKNQIMNESKETLFDSKINQILDYYFLFPNNADISLKYSNLNQIKLYLHQTQRLLTLKLNLYLLKNMEAYIIHLLNQNAQDHRLYMKYYRSAYSLVSSFGRSSPTLVHEFLDEDPPE